MIHLAITKSHLICANWEKEDKQNFLNFVSYQPFNEPLIGVDRSESDILSDINNALQVIRNDIGFEGQSVYVSIPDEFCNSSSVALDFEMTVIDAWEFAKWTINQRWPRNGEFEFFGRYFNSYESKVFAIRVSRAFANPLKIAIQELGCQVEWMGTESSAFFGLSPKVGASIFYPNKTGYRYFSYSQDSFDLGYAKFEKGSWVIISQNGSISINDVFDRKILILGNLSSKRKNQFGGKKITQVSALSGFVIKGNIFSKNLKQKDLERLYVLTPIANGSPRGSAINFLDSPGLHSYKVNSSTLEESPLINKDTKELRIKKSRSKKSTNPMVYFFFFVIAVLALLKLI